MLDFQKAADNDDVEYDHMIKWSVLIVKKTYSFFNQRLFKVLLTLVFHFARSDHVLLLFNQVYYLL